ncbi:rhodanese-like domain-containing protein [Mucilaginibacter terrenus]|uniref:Rhodanese-like domain-containing protein n=1 Tax=Mucilaginibacter terrenus TaxID=2482727 RepID=A0A3E2NT86_9SPHI|nr:rhodanese-like domain-containing protein [Mucilaginibacter terrenus]RFZ84179.1 rhodanese-like domain-containing protein [Mucilaginibacter terrenus]
MSQINAAQLKQRLQEEQLNLLDVREKIEHYTFNIGGLNVPVSQLEKSLPTLPYNKTDEIIVICSKGIRSEHACSILSAHGYHNVVNLKGGLIALQKLNNQ